MFVQKIYMSVFFSHLVDKKRNYSITYNQAKLLARTCKVTYPRANSTILKDGMLYLF